MASRNPGRPNVLFVVSDDQGEWALGCAGNDEIRTPRLDLLAAKGIRFRNFFCTSPVCLPARASILTGDIPSQHGVHDWIRAGSMGEGRIDYLAGQTLITDVLADSGYRCGDVIVVMSQRPAKVLRMIPIGREDRDRGSPAYGRKLAETLQCLGVTADLSRRSQYGVITGPARGREGTFVC